MGTILRNRRFFANQIYTKIMITYEFGINGHQGIDLVAVKEDEKGTYVGDIMAHDGGVVTAAAFDSQIGNYIIVKIDDKYSEKYEHLAKMNVKTGDKITKGQVIGTAGATGSLAQGAHLHWGIIENGKYIDPKPFLDKDVKMETPAPATTSLKAGTKYDLKSVASYQSPDAKTSSGPRSGVYYIWSEEVNMGRIRMTNRLDRVGVKGQVSFFVNVADLVPVSAAKPVTVTPDPVPVAKPVKSLKAGTKYDLKSVASYQSPDAKTSSGPRSGVYYIWSEEVNMGRIRMTNRLDRVGVKGQVSFFVNVADLK